MAGLPRWTGWPIESLCGHDVPVDPDDAQISAGAYLLTITELAFAVPVAVLPPAPTRPDEPIEIIAADTVGALAELLSSTVNPVISTLDGAR